MESNHLIYNTASNMKSWLTFSSSTTGIYISTWKSIGLVYSKTWKNSQNSKFIGKLCWQVRLALLLYPRLMLVCSICRTKQGRQSRALMGISWYQRVYDVINEVSPKPRLFCKSSIIHNYIFLSVTIPFYWEMVMTIV